MVKLVLSSTKANARYFPHAGYLALTPLKVEGVVRTRLDDDRKPILAADVSVAVRCYEARIGRAGITHSNLLVEFQTPLWSKQPHEPWAELGEADWPFRLVLPPKLAGHSTANFREYRVFWRVEAVLNHIPMTGVGNRQVKTFDLPLMRYDPGDALPPVPAAWSQTAPAKHPGAPSLRYLINTPPFPLGPMDIVPVSLKLSPADPAARVHAVALAVERRLEFHDPPPGSSNGKSPADERSLSSTTNLVERGSAFSHRGTPKVNTFLVASAEASDVPRDENGVYTKTVTLQVPTQKSSSHWAVGETMRTALVTLRFFLRVKVTLATPHGTLETLDLEERELRLIATNEAQRRVALTKYNEAVERTRAARDPNANRLPSPPPSPAEPPLTANSMHTKGSAKPKSARRPHTSSGTGARERRSTQSFRDLRARERRPHVHAHEREGGSEPEPVDPVHQWEGDVEHIETQNWLTVAAETSQPSPTGRSAPALRSFFASPKPPAVGNPLSSASTNRPPTTSMNQLSPVPPAPDPVQAWEEELERIAAQSRRRSVEMLGFNAERRTRPRIDIAVATTTSERSPP